MFRKGNGFTIIELLVVISVIGILSGVMVSVINAPRKRAEAQDSVRMSDLQSAVTGLEIHNASEGSYPVDTNGDRNPLNDGANGLSTYLKQWPVGLIYSRQSESNFAVYIPKATDTSHCFKYVASDGRIRSCTITSTCAENNYTITGCATL